MPQPVAIQTEILPAVSAPKLGNKAPDGDKAAFSDALDAHMAKDQGGTTSHLAKEGKVTDPKTEAAKTDKAEKSVAENEQNLPTQKADSEQAESEGVDKDVISSAAVSEVQAQPSNETTIDTTVETDTEVSATDTETASDEGGEDVPSDNSKIEKPIRAQVEVAQQAVANAQAAPVEMTAKDKPQPDVKAQPTQIKEVAAAPLQTTLVPSAVESKVTKEAKVVTTPTTPANTEVKVAPTQPEIKPLAAVEKTIATTEPEKVVSQTPLRADLMDALKRQPQNEMMTEKVRQALLSQTSEQGQKATTNNPVLLAGKLTELPPQAAATLTSPIFSSATSTTATSATTLAATPTVSFPVQPTMQQAAWSKVMSSRVVFMAKEGLQQAELRMTPANLGPVEVRLQVQNEQASVTFLAQHAATREALEQALPKLREQFAEAGLELGQAEVGAQTQEQHEADDSEEAMIFSQASDTLDDTEVKEDLQNNSAEVATGISVYA